MKIYFDANSMIKDKEEWAFTITPCTFLSRHDVFSDEAAYYIGFVWLIFRVSVIITYKKKEIPTGEEITTKD